MSEITNDSDPTQPIGDVQPAEVTAPAEATTPTVEPVPAAPAYAPAYPPAAPVNPVAKRNAMIAGAAVAALLLVVGVFAAGVAVGGRARGTVDRFGGPAGTMAQAPGMMDGRQQGALPGYPGADSQDAQQVPQGQGHGGRGMRGGRGDGDGDGDGVLDDDSRGRRSDSATMTPGQ